MKTPSAQPDGGLGCLSLVAVPFVAIALSDIAGASDHFPWFALLLLLAGAVAGFVSWHNYHQQKRLVDAERSLQLSRPVPPDIERDMRAFEAGEFHGEEVSPLAYIGYRVGKTRGLSPTDRQRRLKVCFHMEMPKGMPEKYSNWGRPATRMRYDRMAAHLAMLANQRRTTPAYIHAVAHWDADRIWFVDEFETVAKTYGKYGYAR